MGTRKPEDIRTIALVSHGGAGKTSLAEAMLFDSGAITRMGKVEDKNTVDYRINVINDFLRHNPLRRGRACRQQKHKDRKSTV